MMAGSYCGPEIELSFPLITCGGGTWMIASS